MQALGLSVCSDFLAERGGEGQSEMKSEGTMRVRANVRLRVAGTWGPGRGGAKARHTSLTATASGHLQHLRIPPGNSLLCCL